MPGFPILELPDEIIAMVLRCSKGAASRLRLGMACKTLNAASMQRKLWQNVHFYDEPSTAAKLTDTALECLLRRVSARQYLVRLNLRDCFLVSGSGLGELVGSTVLRELDLRRGNGEPDGSTRPTGTAANPATLDASAITTLIQSCGVHALEQVYVGRAAYASVTARHTIVSPIETSLRLLEQAKRRRRRRCDGCKLKSKDKESCPKPNCQKCTGPSVSVLRCSVCNKRSCGGKLDPKSKCPQMKSCGVCHWSACTTCIDKKKAETGGMLFRKCHGCKLRVCKHKECKNTLQECEGCAKAFCEGCSVFCEERDMILCHDCEEEVDWSDEDSYDGFGDSDEYDSEGEEGWDDM
tara:strand:- start:4609 stop:5664 length:1056 start_codon:yes stop_codon:yes gene_type:complete